MRTALLELPKDFTLQQLQEIIEASGCLLLDFVDEDCLEEIDKKTREAIRKGKAEIKEGIFFSDDEVDAEALKICMQ